MTLPETGVVLGSAEIGAPLFEGPGGDLTVHASNLSGGPFDNVSDFAGLPFATTTTSDPTLSAGDVILLNLPAAFDDEFLAIVGPGGSLFFAEDVSGTFSGTTGSRFAPPGGVELGVPLFEGPGGILTVSPFSLSGPLVGLQASVVLEDLSAFLTGFADFVALEATRETVTTIPGRSLTIDASITTTITGVAAQAATIGDVSVTEPVTALIGNLSTTALGAVNTGEIGLGTNQVVEEALSGVSEATRLTVQQIGTQTGETVLALNSALNTANIDGSISNTFEGVNASVAAISPDQFEITAAGNLTAEGISELMGSVETTVIGAVNTGTIISGVNNQVQGTVASIVGNSATNAFE